MPRNIFYLLITAILIASCSAQPGTPANQPAVTSIPSVLASLTLSPAPSSTPMPPTPTPDLIKMVCSPLEGEMLASINEIMTQAFKMPRPGNDDGHQGVDFSFYRRNEKVGIEGLQVYSALQGTVVTVINNNWPYGNAVIIETPLESISPELISMLQIPSLQPMVMPDPRVNCPAGELSFSLDQEARSLYLLYGHLMERVSLPVGEKVECGQKIGVVGNTGYSSNPHLHFETRVGPSSARFDSMAYYTVNSTVSERYNYCVWRVSNLFQLFDPMTLLSPQEK